MAPKRKQDFKEMHSPTQRTSGSSPARTPTRPSKRKTKHIIEIQDANDNIPIAELAQKAWVPPTPKTPKKQESVSASTRLKIQKTKIKKHVKKS